MQKVKGSVLKSRLDFVKEHFGEDQVRQVLASLGADHQAALKKMVPSTWLPFEIGKRLDEAIVQVCGAGDPRFFEQLGVASADKNLTTLHASFVTPGDPEAFLRKAPQIYELYYQTGRRAWQKTGEGEGYLTTHDAETFSAPDCLTVVGWYKRALEMCGATHVRVEEEECRALGGAVCRYRVRWE